MQYVTAQIRAAAVARKGRKEYTLQYVTAAGLLLLLLGSNGLGHWFCRQKIQHRRQLTELAQLLVLLQGEIRCHKMVLEDAFVILQGRTSGFCCVFLQAVLTGLRRQDGRSFAEIWNRAVESVGEQAVLSKEEKNMWMEIGSRIGYLDLQMQEQVLEQYIRLFVEKAQKLEGEEAESCRLYRVFGAAGGLLLAVLLL